MQVLYHKRTVVVVEFEDSPNITRKKLIKFKKNKHYSTDEEEPLKIKKDTPIYTGNETNSNLAEIISSHTGGKGRCKTFATMSASQINAMNCGGVARLTPTRATVAIQQSKQKYTKVLFKKS